jgi:two-component system response regulator NreC
MSGPFGPGGAITLVIADDQQLVRAAVRALLEAEGDLEIVGEASDVAATERCVLARRPRVLILDLQMPGGSGLSAIPRIRASVPQTEIVVLTGETDPAVAREALRGGALGYVLKDAFAGELVQAVRSAARDEPYLNPQLGGRLVTERHAPVHRRDQLSRRELEVLRLVALGHTNQEIGALLGLSPRTVDSHRARVRAKTGKKSLAELVRYALERDLL